MTHLTAIILTYNESHHIQACIESVRFADAVIVFDSFSTNDTPALARQAGATVIQHPFTDFATQRNAAIDAVAGKTDWVLFVDADERVTPKLAEEIRLVLLKPQAVGYRIPRHNYIFGKLTRGAGWYPDYQTRLLKIGATQYDPNKRVHEVVMLRGAEGTLEHPLTHYNYDDVAQFHRKQQKYVQLDAQILYDEGVQPKAYTPYTQPVRHFWWRFVTLKGYQDGLHGLHLSLLMSWYEYRKYQLLQTMC